MTVVDYFKYVWRHLQPFFTDAKVRSAVWQIWFNRDYTAWVILQNNPAAYTLKDWSVSNRLHSYIRKDITNLLWPLGAAAQPPVQPVDPYEGITSPVTPDQVLGTSGSEAGQFVSPRQIALAADGSLYVADSLNHRIQHIAARMGRCCRCGDRLQTSRRGKPCRNLQRTVGSGGGSGWECVRGGHVELPHPEVHGGGEVHQDVGDGTGPRAGWFYGPRGLAVDGQGRVYVADTGNKRIVIYDGAGNYLGEFGEPGWSWGRWMSRWIWLLRGRAGVCDGHVEPAGGGVRAGGEWVGVYGGGRMAGGGVVRELAGEQTVCGGRRGGACVCDGPEAMPGDRVQGSDGTAGAGMGGMHDGRVCLPSGIVSDGEGGLWVSDARNGTLVHFKTQLRQVQIKISRHDQSCTSANSKRLV